MADVITNLKVRFGADTQKFKKDMDQGKSAVSNFTGQAGSAFDKFASVFGVNMSAIKVQLEAAKSSSVLLGKGFKEAAAGSGFLSKALKILRLALVSTGIGAIVVALGSLIAYFTKTQRGIDAVKRVTASLKATFDVFVDRASLLGESIVNAFKNPKQAVIDLWETIKTNLVNRVIAFADLWKALGKTFSSEWKDGLSDLLTASIKLTTGLNENQQTKIVNGFKSVVNEIKEEAKAANNLEKAMQVLEQKEIDLITVQAKRKQQIEDLRLAAKDETKSAEERQKAIADAISIEKQVLADEISIQKERVRIMKEKIDLGESTREDYRELANAEAELNNLQAESSKTLQGLQGEYNTLSNEIEANTKEVIKNRDELSNFLELDLKDTKDSQSNLKYKVVSEFDADGFEIGSKKVLDDRYLETAKLEGNAEKIKSIYSDLKDNLIEVSPVITESLNNLAFSFGENIGLMIAGVEESKSINQIIGEVFGEMAINLGKVVVAAGIAFFALGESFKLALVTPGAAIGAIVAGAALIAAGTAVKASIANVASGGSGAFASNSSVYDTRSSTALTSTNGRVTAEPVNIRVTGTFRQVGKDLVAVIDQERQSSLIRN